MIPTQRSVIARLRYRSLDGGWSEVSLCRATRIRVFPRNAVTEKKIFRAERNISSLSTPLTNSAEQHSSWTVLWFSSSVRFSRAIFHFGAMTCKWEFYLYILFEFGSKLVSFRHLYSQNYLPKLPMFVNLSRINK